MLLAYENAAKHGVRARLLRAKTQITQQSLLNVEKRVCHERFY
jgi:hypothetical protein